MNTTRSGPSGRGPLTAFSTPSDLEFRAVRQFDAPKQFLFDAHTKPEHVQQWMTGPDGWTMPVCEIDLRVGGAWRFVWRRDSGSEMEMNGEYREITPYDRLVTTESWGGPWPPTVNSLDFVEHDGKTTLTMTIRYPSREARDAATATGMTSGMNTSYNRLAAHVAASHIERAF